MKDESRTKIWRPGNLETWRMVDVVNGEGSTVLS